VSGVLPFGQAIPFISLTLRSALRRVLQQFTTIHEFTTIHDP
jgi:hypothetical protein